MTKTRLHADDGRISIFIAVFTLAVLFLTAVIVDGGGRIRTLQTADNVATQAARAAGQAIYLPDAIAGGAKRIDPQRAAQAAEQYLASAGATGTVNFSPDFQHVFITVSMTYQPKILGAFGTGPMNVTASAHAQLVSG